MIHGDLDTAEDSPNRQWLAPLFPSNYPTPDVIGGSRRLLKAHYVSVGA